MSSCMETPAILGGFGRADLADCLPERRPVDGPVQANVVCFRSPDGGQALYCVLDFMDFDFAAVETLKAAAMSVSGIDAGNVHILTTHNHGAGALPELEIARLVPALTQAVRQALSGMEPLFMAFAEIRVPEQLNYHRRIRLKEFEDRRSTTIYWGPSPENGYGAEASLALQMEVLRRDGACSFGGSNEANPDENGRRMPPADPCLAVWRFTNSAGAVKGWFCRFAAHAICCNHPGHYSGDFPAYVRSTLEEAVGGQAIFFNGPCGEIAPGLPDKHSHYEVKLGRRLAQLALEALEDKPVLPLTQMVDRSAGVPVSIRKDFPGRREPEPIPPFLPELEQKRIEGERQLLLSRKGFLESKMETPDGPGEARIGLLRLNNTLLLSLPGETFWASGEKILRKCRLNAGESLVTATEHDRTLMYIVPLEECSLGGFENTCRLVDDAFEPRLVEAALSLVARMG